jgi:hypothetical protein
MIRQTINCDICPAEKQATSYWFVAYEQSGEITLRGWESPTKSRKNAKHLCGQKCVQRMMSNFTAAVMSSGHGMEMGKEAARETGPEAYEQHTARDPKDLRERDETHAAERIPIDPDLIAAVEAESWAGPVRPKENLWDMPHKAKVERESFLQAARPKSNAAANNRLHKMA